jgi:hypothetical protein
VDPVPDPLLLRKSGNVHQFTITLFLVRVIPDYDNPSTENTYFHVILNSILFALFIPVHPNML